MENTCAEKGLEYIKKALKEPVLALIAAEAAVEYLHTSGREDEVEEIITDTEKRMNEINVALAVHTEINRDDNIIPHGLDRCIIEHLAESIGDIRSKIAELYLVKKTDKTGKLMPVYFLVFKQKISSFSFPEDSETLAEKIAAVAEFPFEFYVTDINTCSKLKKILKKSAWNYLVFSR